MCVKGGNICICARERNVFVMCFYVQGCARVCLQARAFYMCVGVCALVRVWQGSDSCPLLGCKPFCAQCGQTAHSSIWKMLTLLIKGQTRVIMISLCWEGRDGGGAVAGEGRNQGGGVGVSVGRRACQPHHTRMCAHTHTQEIFPFF